MATLDDLQKKLIARVKQNHDLQIAIGSIKSIVDAGALAQGLNEALLIAASVSYSRAFKNSKGVTTATVGEFQSEMGFDLEIHDHLLKMRDRVTAHSQHDANPVELSLLDLPIDNGVRQAPACGMFISILSMWKFKTEAHRTRVLAHLSATQTAVIGHIQALQDEYLGIYNNKPLAIARGADAKFEGRFADTNAGQPLQTVPVDLIKSERLDFPLSDQIICQVNSIRPGCVSVPVWRIDGKKQLLSLGPEVGVCFSGPEGAEIIVSE